MPAGWRTWKAWSAIPSTFLKKWTCGTKTRSVTSCAARHHPCPASGGGIACGPLHFRSGRFHPDQHRGNLSIFGGGAGGVGRAKWAGKRFHHVSTDEVYGSLGPTGYFTETTPYAPNSPYSASKAASDFLVRSYHHTYGLPVVTTNCSNNYGPRQFPEKLIPVIIESICAQGHPGLWRRPECARLALCARPRRGAVAGVEPGRTGKVTISAGTTSGPTFASSS
jgi:hypothetical protein